MPYELNKVSKEELDIQKKKCWWSGCNSHYHFEDWVGWRWCFKHYWTTLKGKENKWFFIRTTKIF